MTVIVRGQSAYDANIAVLRELGARARDQRPVWNRVVRELKDAVDEQFATEGVRLNGRRWKPLTPAYASQKKAAGFATGILTRTGRLRKSFRKLETSKNRLVFGSRMDRAAWHQHGTRKMAARPILNGGIGVTRDVNKVLKHYIETGRVMR